MSMYNDTECGAEGNPARCEYNSQTVANYARKFPRGHWSFLKLGSEKKWYGTYTGRPDGSWDKIAEQTMVNFSESGHPIFRASSAFGSGELRSKGGGKKATHFNGSDENIELLFRTVISANQLSVYGAVANLWTELSENFGASVKPKALDYLGTTEIPPCRSVAETHANAQQRTTWRKNTRENSNKCPKTRNYLCYVAKRVWSWSKKDRTPILLIQTKENRCNIYAENTQWLGTKKGLVWEDGFTRIRDLSCLQHKSLQSWWPIQYWSPGPIFIWRPNRILG